MDDLINIKKDLFDTWIGLDKPIGMKLLEYLVSENIQPKDYFSHVCQSIMTDDNIGTSITNLQLKDLLLKFGLINSQDEDNNDLILGELTHASMILDNTENILPDDFGNIVHEEVEGQKTACARNFDQMAKALHNIPIIGDTVVVTEGPYKYNIGFVKEHNDDGTISVFFNTAVYTGTLEQELLEGKEYQIHSSQHGDTCTGVVKKIDGDIHVVITNILLKFNNSSIHIQSKHGEQPVEFDIVNFIQGINKGKQAFITKINENIYTVILLNGTQLNAQSNEITLYSGHLVSYDENSQHPHLPTPGIQLPTSTRIPMPLFDPPTRDENPIPERESNILCCAFPTLFQTGNADLNAPRLRSLHDGKEDALEGFIRHCHFWHDNRFTKHNRFFYCLFNRLLRFKLFKTKSYYMKNKKPTAEDFLPKNKNKKPSEK